VANSRFDKNDLLRSSDADYPIIDGDPNQYPRDEYYSEMIIGMTDSNGAPIPLSIGLVGNVQSWIVDSNVVDLKQGGNIRVELWAKRSFIIKFFSFVIS
jgi:hypothetical protein